MDGVLVELHAMAPAANRFRSWRIEFDRDLFGVLTARVTFGRIGCTGRTRQWAFADGNRAATFLRAKLRRRATGPQRIGAAYRVVDASVVAWPFLDSAGLRPADGAAAAGSAGRFSRQPQKRTTKINRAERAASPRFAMLL